VGCVFARRFGGGGRLFVNGVLCSAYAKPSAFVGVRVPDHTVHRLCHAGAKALHWAWWLAGAASVEQQKASARWLKTTLVPLVVGAQCAYPRRRHEALRRLLRRVSGGKMLRRIWGRTAIAAATNHRKMRLRTVSKIETSLICFFFAQLVLDRWSGQRRHNRR
jgi:hypothetical protein